MGRTKEDLTNKIFERLTVLRQAEDYISPNGKHITQWECKCDCGNEIIVIGNSLKKGKTKSCGCIFKETHKKYNIYDLSGEYGVGLTSNTNKEFYFDLEDYNKIKDYCWVERVYKNKYRSIYAAIPNTKKTD